MSSYAIRLANEADIAGLVTFGKEAFTQTFGHLYTADNLHAYLKEAYTAEKYHSWINDRDNYRLWLAKRDEESVAGYVLCGNNTLPIEDYLTTNHIPRPAEQCGEIKRLYCHPSTFGTGLAQDLMKTAMTWLQERYEDQVYLGVFSENFRAQRFYEKLDFAKVGEYGFVVGDGVDLEFIYKYVPKK